VSVDALAASLAASIAGVLATALEPPDDDDELLLPPHAVTSAIVRRVTIERTALRGPLDVLNVFMSTSPLSEETSPTCQATFH
jgi:hypothetical protein